MSFQPIGRAQDLFDILTIQLAPSVTQFPIVATTETKEEKQFYISLYSTEFLNILYQI